MGITQTWNIANAEFTMKCNLVPGCDLDVIREGAIDADGSIEVTFPSAQVIVKEDALGEYSQLSFLNSKKTDLKIATMHGSPLHNKAAKIVAQRAIVSGLRPVVTCCFKDPILGIRYTFTGSIEGQPNISFQGELKGVEISMTGTSAPHMDPNFDILQQGLNEITRVQGVNTI